MPSTFQYDIFLSYGWSGNAPDEGDRQWVSQLKRELEAHLATPLGRQPTVFIDIDATRTGPLSQTLENALDHSRLLLFVVTPGSCASNWCNWEILRFLDRGLSIASRTDVLLPIDRLFGVQAYPVNQEQLPKPLQPIVFRPFDLTQPVQDRPSARRPATWGQFPQLARDEFYRLIADLAQRLQCLGKQEAEPIPSTGVQVFLGLAPTTNLEQQQLSRLHRDLVISGHKVLRASPAPAEEEESYRLRLQAILEATRCTIHILARSTVPKPDNWTRSPTGWQIQIAEDSGVRRFAWEDYYSPPDPSDRFNPQRDDQHLDNRQPFASLEVAVKEFLSAPAPEESPQQPGDRSVVIAHHPTDEATSVALAERLRNQHGIQVTRALPPGEQQKQRNETNRRLFRQHTAVLICHNPTEPWLTTTCYEVRQQCKFRKLAALVVEPPPPQTPPHQAHFEVLQRQTAVDFAAVDSWAHRVKGSQE